MAAMEQPFGENEVVSDLLNPLRTLLRFPNPPTPTDALLYGLCLF